MSTQKVSDAMIADMAASKLSGALPALDGSALTGLPDSVTKNASDPATDTNPSGGLGTLWLNTTSGEMFILTDATAGANVWTNVGGGEGDVRPWLAFRATIAGYHSGGVPNTTTIDKYSFTTDSNATTHGDMTVAREGHCGQSSETHGYSSGGEPSALNVIDKFAFAGSGVTATDVGDLTVGRSARSGQTSPTHGYATGGEPVGTKGNIIDKFPFASDANATDVGNLSVARYYTSGQSSVTHGYTSGGHDPANSDVIDKFTFAADNDATDVGNLTSARGLTSGQSSETHGYVSGGYTSSTAIDKFTFASDANATSVGTLIAGGQSTGGSSSTTHGYEAGGYTPAGSNHNTIEKFSFATDGNATDVGDLTGARRYGAGNQN